MKFTKNILMVLGLLLQVGASCAAFSQGQAILDRISKEESTNTSDWENNGPTREDILAATKVENLAAKGSLEDKLIRAVKNGDLKNVEVLVVGADLEARDNEDMTALMIAAKEGYNDIASLLINAGAHVDATDRYNSTALWHAVFQGHTDIVKLLIANDNGAAKNDKGLEGFFLTAVFKGNNEMVKALLALDISSDALAKAIRYARITCSAEVLNAINERLTKTNS